MPTHTFVTILDQELDISLFTKPQDLWRQPMLPLSSHYHCHSFKDKHLSVNLHHFHAQPWYPTIHVWPTTIGPISLLNSSPLMHQIQMPWHTTPQLVTYFWILCREPVPGLNPAFASSLWISCHEGVFLHHTHIFICDLVSESDFETHVTAPSFLLLLLLPVHKGVSSLSLQSQKHDISKDWMKPNLGEIGN